LIRLLLDTGMRRGKLAGMAVADVDFESDVALVIGKSGRPRACPFGKKTAVALDRYLREPRFHPHANLDALWLGQCGPVKPMGFSRSSRSEVGAREFRASVRVSSATLLLRRGYRKAATRVTLCGSPVGARERCSIATERPQQMRGPGKRTGA
jgi:integrase